MDRDLACWCGNQQLLPFSPDYLQCSLCESLVWAGKSLSPGQGENAQSQDYYNREYWFSHQTEALGFNDIKTRSRVDLPERCLYWLQTVLKYRLPPARVLELGSAHGGFVALLKEAGFDAVGLEIDPWVVDYAQRTFDIRMLQGRIEEQKLEPASFDLIVLMDVLEHLPDPLQTMAVCMRLLSPGGFLMVQTPWVPAGKPYAELLQEKHDFARMLIPQEHIHLFSQKGIEELFNRLQLYEMKTEAAFFPSHDQFVIASRAPISPQAPEEVEKYLLSSAKGRLILALLDQDKLIKKLEDELKVITADHAARLALILQLEGILRKQDRILKWMPQNIWRRTRKVFQKHTPPADRDD